MPTLNDALALCKVIRGIAPKYGCHVALTGGCLYKEGERKDIDLIIYRIRQVEQIDHESLFLALEAIGIKKVSGSGWCHKAIYKGINIDLLFPEEVGGEYEKEED